MTPQIDQQKLATLKEKLAASDSIKNDIQSLIHFLPASEYQLILFMNEQGAWQGPLPPPPAGFNSNAGSIELGLFNYWFKNPDQLDLSQFTPKEKGWVLAIIALVDILVLPNSQMTTENYNFFKTNELIYKDGTVLSMAKWTTYDQGWFTAFLNLVETLLNFLWYNKWSFPAVTVPPIPLNGASASSVTIAILGDWGTGDATSQAVINQAVNLNPDYILHVGDVYYGGTPLVTDPGGPSYFSPGEESSNLLAQWPAAYRGKSFTLNSNHEMYSGGNGLFYDALGVGQNPIGASTPFNAQQGNSCFLLQYGGWSLLGLDTGFQASVTSAFMNGSIGGVAGVQVEWIKSLGLDPSKTIVFTHHNGVADDCSSVASLWAEVQGALNGDPYAWYWGHVHNGIVYDQPLSFPASNPIFSTNTYARCCGHSALPYGPASHLAGQPIEWVANSPQPAPSKQLYNGFATITLEQANGQVTSITENFYDLSNNPQPVFTKTIYKS